MIRSFHKRLSAAHRKRSVASIATNDGNLSDFDVDNGDDVSASPSGGGGIGGEAEVSLEMGNTEPSSKLGLRRNALGGSRDDDLDMEGLTIITVDDGKGGLKHVRVSKPPDGQEDVAEQVGGGGGGGGVGSSGGADGKKGSSEAGGRKISLGDMLKQEFTGRSFFQLEGEKLRKRIVSKRGVVNIGQNHMDEEKFRFITDFFNTMLDMKWRYVLTIFCLSFFLSWLAFAGVWYLIFLLHGDFEPGHLPDEQAASGWTPCAYAIHNFKSCFLFSLETQHTIGYGGRQTTEECPAAIAVMSFQSVIGVIIQACMVGTIFAKLTRPKKRANTLLFTKNAVICRRDGYHCLCFRVANLRQSHLVETHVRAILVTKKVTEEGEVIPFYQTELDVGTDMEGQEDTLFFIWPSVVTHRIDESSPFYNMSARDFLKKRYEIIVVLEGIVEPTGMSIQVRTSYLPYEILWGYRFVNVLNFNRKANMYQVDYGSFNKVLNADMPTCSAKTYDFYYKAKAEDDAASAEVHSSSEQKLFRRSTIEDRPSAAAKRPLPPSVSYVFAHSESDVSLRPNHVAVPNAAEPAKQRAKKQTSFKVEDEIKTAGSVAVAVSEHGGSNYSNFARIATPTTPVVML